MKTSTNSAKLGKNSAKLGKITAKTAPARTPFSALVEKSTAKQILKNTNTEREGEKLKKLTEEQKGLCDKIKLAQTQRDKIMDLLEEYVLGEDEVHARLCREKIDKLSDSIDTWTEQFIATKGVPEPFKYGERITVGRRLTSTAVQLAETKLKLQAGYYRKGGIKSDAPSTLGKYIDIMISILRSCYYRISYRCTIVGLDSGLRELVLDYIYDIQTVLVAHKGEMFSKEISKECFRELGKKLYKDLDRVMKENGEVNTSDGDDYKDRRLVARYSNIYRPRVELSKKMSSLITGILEKEGFSETEIRVFLRILDGDEQKFIAEEEKLSESKVSRIKTEVSETLKVYTKVIWNTVSDKRKYPDYVKKMTKKNTEEKEKISVHDMRDRLFTTDHEWFDGMSD